MPRSCHLNEEFGSEVDPLLAHTTSRSAHTTSLTPVGARTLWMFGLQSEPEPAGRAAGEDGALRQQSGGPGGGEVGSLPRGEAPLRRAPVPDAAEVSCHLTCFGILYGFVII